jgi:arylsulfatase A-like enzyme
MMNRQRICLCLEFVLLVLFFSIETHAEEPVSPPNVILFLIDDCDKPETSVYGGNVLTPNLDRMAAEGMTFHRAHMTTTVCTPSRYSCLTGRYAGSSTFHGYLEECPLGNQGLPAFNVGLEPDNRNVGAVLSEHGYVTGYVGKYHVGGEEAGHAGLHAIEKNAEYSEELNRMQFENEKTHRQLIMNRGFDWAKNIYWENMRTVFRGHNPEWTVAAAREFIRENRDRPFYLHYCTTLLHGPNGEWARSLEKPEITGEGIVRPDPEASGMPSRASVMERILDAGLTENEAGYLWMDDSLGAILDLLDELGIAENTIVVFIADHGSTQKGSLYTRAGTEVPCLIRWPTGIEAGTECDALIQNTDFVPTWFDLAGVETPEEYRMDGVSLATLFEDPTTSVRDHVYCEIGASRAIKTKDWTYMALRFTSDQVEEVEARPNSLKRLLGLSGGVARGAANPAAFDYDQLYDTSRDSDETRNLAQVPRHADMLAEMQALLIEDLRRFPDRPFGEFIPGGNALPIGGCDELLERAREGAEQ